MRGGGDGVGGDRMGCRGREEGGWHVSRGGGGRRRLGGGMWFVDWDWTARGTLVGLAGLLELGPDLGGQGGRCDGLEGRVGIRDRLPDDS